MASKKTKTSKQLSERSRNDEAELARSDRQVLESNIAEKLGESPVDKLSTAQEQIVGEDHGAKRVLAHMNLVVADPIKAAALTKEKVMEIAMGHFTKHCAEIGWWPSGEYPDVIVSKREDGSWHCVSYLKQSTYHKVKDWSDFPRVAVDTRTDEDVDNVNGKK